MLNLRPCSHLIVWICQALTILVCISPLVAPGEVRSQTAPPPDPVDSNAITVFETHDIPPTVGHLDVPPTICARGGKGNMMTAYTTVHHDRGR
jgi:hypothetical protein